MLRVVLDTNILVSALKSNRGASYALLSMLPSTLFEIAVTIPLYSEYRDVLTRPNHLAGVSTKEEILGFLRYLCGIAHRQEVFFLWRPWLKDPKDDMVLEAAIASRCSYIVTHNLKDFRTPTLELQFGVTAVTPGEFLGILRRYR